MKLEKLPYEPAGLIDFFGEGLQTLGAVCERSWHDRLQVLAENKAAKLWSDTEPLIEVELHFPPLSDASPRDATKEIFPGCPLTFRLADELRGSGLVLERAVIRFETELRAPLAETAARLWRTQFPNSARYEQLRPFVQDWGFSLMLLLRCEIQAIDQHWSLHRLALGWPGGEPDGDLATRLEFAEIFPHPAAVPWISVDPASLSTMIQKALQDELSSELGPIQTRQQQYLRRELERVDEYFDNYERELQARKSSKKDHHIRVQERLAAARQEHQRRREDQVQRHEIRVFPHLDSMLLLAEPCWRTGVKTGFQPQEIHEALFLPRSRSWRLARPPQPGVK
jgi:hypothetical protein